jgi:hypothetical protein
MIDVVLIQYLCLSSRKPVIRSVQSSSPAEAGEKILRINENHLGINMGHYSTVQTDSFPVTTCRGVERRNDYIMVELTVLVVFARVFTSALNSSIL